MRLSNRTAALAAGAALAYTGWRALRQPEEMDLTGRAVLITGGSRGLGLVLAREFARHGCRLAICARDPLELDHARRDLERRGVEVMAETCDVSERESVERFVDLVESRFGGIDVLVNNAGIIQVGPLESMTIEDFEHAIDVNLLGMIYTTLAALPGMRARARTRAMVSRRADATDFPEERFEAERPRIVNITSIGGKVSVPHLLPYGTAKFGTVGFSEGLRAELAADGIRVTTVVPGLMRTGSPVNALFKGQAAREFTWFSLGDALPFTSISAEKAARRIVLAARRGETEVTLSWQAKLLRVAHALAPGAMTNVLGVMNRLLPGANGRAAADGRQVRGMELETAISPSPITSLMNRAARENNEYGGRPRPSARHARKMEHS